MKEIHLKLILIYLNDYEDQYELHEIKKLCNYTTSQMFEALQSIEEKGFIQYENNKFSLKILDKGREYLQENNLNEISIDDLYESTVTLNISNNTIGFEDIYIPQNFKK
ncbi:hypothetical protein GCM10008983_09970 [Lentibacillus halophilus]|uniref:Uncharacterized protein n=1 Tax=Lentibacillus halophilus TaxID=295065 RepID=A0ABP3J003_9BACI